MRFWIVLPTLLAACASAPEAQPPAGSLPESDPPAPTLTEQMKSADLETVRRYALTDLDSDGEYGHVLTLLRHHWPKAPQDATLNALLAEAHAKTVDTLDLKKPEEKPRWDRHRQAGLFHARKAVEAAPESGHARYWLGALLLYTADLEQSYGRLKEALAELLKAEKLDPKVDDGGPARMLGRIYQETPGFPFLGSKSKAIEWYRKSIEIAPRRLLTHLWLAETYAADKQADAARKEIQGVLQPQAEDRVYPRTNGEIRKKAQELLKRL